MSGGRPEDVRTQIERKLRARLDEAAQHYHRAVETYQALRGAPGEHDPEALKVATAEYRGAIQRYDKALRYFARFVIEGEIPPDLEQGPANS